MNTSYLFWLLVILSVATLFVFWREPFISFLENLWGWDKALEEELTDGSEKLEIEIPAEAFSEEEGEEQERAVAGELTPASKEGRSLSELDRIESEVKRVSRRTQVIRLQIEEMQREQERLEDVETQLKEISLQLEEISVQVEALEAGST